MINVTFLNAYSRSERGEEVKLMNPHIQEMKEDVLYHLALGSGSHDLEKMFGDVKYVCMGGTPQRMKRFAGFQLTIFPIFPYSSLVFFRIYVNSARLRSSHWHLSY